MHGVFTEFHGEKNEKYMSILRFNQIKLLRKRSVHLCVSLRISV